MRLWMSASRWCSGSWATRLALFLLICGWNVQPSSSCSACSALKCTIYTVNLSDLLEVPDLFGLESLHRELDACSGCYRTWQIILQVLICKSLVSHWAA